MLFTLAEAQKSPKQQQMSSLVLLLLVQLGTIAQHHTTHQCEWPDSARQRPDRVEPDRSDATSGVNWGLDVTKTGSASSCS